MPAQKNSKPGEKLTVAGIAAVIVVAVFVVCVVLILAKSLFPSNSDSKPDGVYTGTKASSTSVAAASKPDDTDSKTDSKTVSIVDESAANLESSTDSTNSQDVTFSAAEGEQATLNQTAYMRSTGDENGEPVISVPSGETVTVVERPADSEYVHVTYNGFDGWIWGGYLG